VISQEFTTQVLRQASLLQSDPKSADRAAA
jgi:hypothetical protein